MINNKGFAPILIILAILFVGGGTYAVVQRDVLKSFFEKGDKPSAEQFKDTIDSSVNVIDDADRTETKVQKTTKPTVLAEDKKEFKLDTVQPVTFRWTAITPKPQEPVTYRLKVWQLMQGQNGSAAMKTNKPIVTKDVTDVTEATVSGIYTGPCKPPYLCDYIWNVEAVTKETTPTATGATPPATSDGASDGTR